MMTWHIDITMEALLIILQIALLPSCYGLLRPCGMSIRRSWQPSSPLHHLDSSSCLHHLLLWMLICYDIPKEGQYQGGPCIFKLFWSWVLDQLPGLKGNSAGPTMQPDPQKLSWVSFVKTWFISERKQSTDPKAIAAPTNSIGRLIWKTTLVSSFHLALSELSTMLYGGLLFEHMKASNFTPKISGTIRFSCI